MLHTAYHALIPIPFIMSHQFLQLTYYVSKHKNMDMEQFPVAMAYVPWQRDCTMYENLDEAYQIGTIFPVLNRPFTGRRCRS